MAFCYIVVFILVAVTFVFYIFVGLFCVAKALTLTMRLMDISHRCIEMFLHVKMLKRKKLLHLACEQG